MWLWYLCGVDAHSMPKKAKLGTWARLRELGVDVASHALGMLVHSIGPVSVPDFEKLQNTLPEATAAMEWAEFETACGYTNRVRPMMFTSIGDCWVIYQAAHEEKNVAIDYTNIGKAGPSTKWELVGR